MSFTIELVPNFALSGCVLFQSCCASVRIGRRSLIGRHSFSCPPIGWSAGLTCNLKVVVLELEQQEQEQDAAAPHASRAPRRLAQGPHAGPSKAHGSPWSYAWVSQSSFIMPKQYFCFVSYFGVTLDKACVSFYLWILPICST